MTEIIPDLNKTLYVDIEDVYYAEYINDLKKSEIRKQRLVSIAEDCYAAYKEGFYSGYYVAYYE